jgi:hypothetical protein
MADIEVVEKRTLHVTAEAAAINMKSATKIGLTVPPSLLSRADQVFR